MLINENTLIKSLLDAKQEAVIEALIKLNKNFSKLKNPLLRNLLARRVTIANACKIAGCPVSKFLESMQQIGFKIDAFPETEQTVWVPEPDFIKTNTIITLDVRPVLAKDQDPLKIILSQVNKLETDQTLKLINTFEPIPLIHLLSEKGFTHTTEFISPEMVFTYFQKGTKMTEEIILHDDRKNADDGRFEDVLSQFKTDKIKTIDVRELEMPKPMLLIIENIEKLTAGEALFVYHKKRPVFLLPELEKRKLKYLFRDTKAGSVDMLIYKL